jgi:hypothetical protein
MPAGARDDVWDRSPANRPREPLIKVGMARQHEVGLGAFPRFAAEIEAAGASWTLRRAATGFGQTIHARESASGNLASSWERQRASPRRGSTDLAAWTGLAAWPFPANCSSLPSSRRPAGRLSDKTSDESRQPLSWSRWCSAGPAVGALRVRCRSPSSRSGASAGGRSRPGSSMCARAGGTNACATGADPGHRRGRA